MTIESADLLLNLEDSARGESTDGSTLERRILHSSSVSSTLTMACGFSAAALALSRTALGQVFSTLDATTRESTIQ